MPASRTLAVHGVEMPRIGLGTWLLNGDSCVEAVRHALEIGYRHIDTARAYGNEREVGRGIAQSDVPRDEIFVASKVWYDDLEPARLMRSTEASLRDLALDHLDLLLIHWPNPDVVLGASLRTMLRLREEGLIRSIGVSNFPAQMFEQALELVPIATNQVELHPYLAQDDVLELAAEYDSSLTAYSPLARGRVAEDPAIAEVAEEAGATPGQVALRWLLYRERVAVVPKASTPERRAENLAALEVELSGDQRQRIDALPKDRRTSDPAWAPDWSA